MILRIFYSVGVLLIVFNLNSCSKKRPPAEEGNQENGLYRTRYDNDSLSREIPYKYGKIHGEAKEYFRSGKLFQLTRYVYGVKHGVAAKYYDNGVLSLETPYDSGKMHGIQRKFRKDGKVAFEMPFDHGNPCTGLKEYGLNGELKTEYPTIDIKVDDNILKEETYNLIISMSNESKNVDFYLGELAAGKCFIEDDVERIYSEKFSGVAKLEYVVYPGMFIMKELNIIARMKTPQGNYYITQRKFNLAIENR